MVLGKFFIYKMKSLGELPFVRLDRRSVLEFARHHGVPTPVIDFTWSPYVAAYFTFGSVQWRHGSDPKDSAIYALSLQNLAIGWTKLFDLPSDEYDSFMYEAPDFFKEKYPADTLKFIWFPASWNERMQRQQGCFLYDGIDYKGTGRFRNFEDLVAKIEEPADASSSTSTATLRKFIVPHSEVRNVLGRLEMANINGTNLLGREGVASDVMSVYNYNPKTGYSWDINFE